jgi:hypothetical protein
MKKNLKKEKEGELWPSMLQPSFYYKIQPSHIIIAYVSCIYTTWFFRYGIEYFSKEERNINLKKEKLWLLMHID